MDKNNHHYVPRFYLKGFSNDSKRINLCNITRVLCIQNASLRDQCSKHKFYGETNYLEDALATIENDISPTLRKLRDPTLIKENTPYDEHLLAFIALQILRTPAEANEKTLSINKMIDKAFKHDTETDTSKYKIGINDSVSMLISLFGQTALALKDLKIHAVLANENQSFITSDNPAVKYNKYCEDIQDFGTDGALCRGLQIFIPISPKVLLVLYDSWVYKVGNKNTYITSNISDSDVDSLNLLQAVNADENVYFVDWSKALNIKDIVRFSKRHRKKSLIQVSEAIEIGNPDSSLIHSYKSVPDLKLDLSFINIRRQAKRLNRNERAFRLRKPISEITGETTHTPSNLHRRIFRKIS